MRTASLILAAAVSIIGLVFPFLLARQANGLNQSILLVLMAGIAGAFSYGAGFRPAAKLLQIATAPWLTWPLMLGSLAALAMIR